MTLLLLPFPASTRRSRPTKCARRLAQSLALIGRRHARQGSEQMVAARWRTATKRRQGSRPSDQSVYGQRLPRDIAYGTGECRSRRPDRFRHPCTPGGGRGQNFLIDARFAGATLRPIYQLKRRSGASRCSCHLNLQRALRPKRRAAGWMEATAWIELDIIFGTRKTPPPTANSGRQAPPHPAPN